jgi:hypothetical protein
MMTFKVEIEIEKSCNKQHLRGQVSFDPYHISVVGNYSFHMAVAFYFYRGKLYPAQYEVQYNIN